MHEAVKNIADSHAQVFVSSSVSYILSQAGMADEARRVLLEDIKKSKTPFYSMAALSDLEKDRGRKKEALKWMERAYNSARGRATRMQWGSLYVIDLMDLAPHQENRILSELQKFYLRYLRMADAFMGRNKTRLDRVSRKIKEWVKSAELKSQITTLRNGWLEKCKSSSTSRTEFYTKACKEYFQGLI